MTALAASAVVLSLPDDGPRVGALFAAALAAWLVPRWLASQRAARLIVPLAALTAALLSAGYVAFYLRGGPRIIDATSYFLQARALSGGWLAFPVGEPEQAVLGRFLVRTDAPVTLSESLGMLFAGVDAARPAATAATAGAAVIFPPGYPAVLALGFRLGAPLAVGPAIGAAVVLATAALGAALDRRLQGRWWQPDGSGAPGHDGPRLAHVAALFSALSPAMRYHTADTMAHGLSALCVAIALAATLRALDASVRAAAASWALAGLALGWLVATRPVSAVAPGLVMLLAVASPRSRAAPRRPPLPLAALAALALGALPGITLWLAHQLAATGSVWGSAQSLYYALGDGPTGCFRYGFGRSIGCLGEHGTFVEHNLPAGYGLLEAVGTSARRLEHHLGDPLGFAPLFLLVPLGAWLGRSVGLVRALALGLLAQLVAYAPFYFDGNYPGGGARMLADLLPVEHVLAAVALRRLALRAPRGRPAGAWLGGLAVAGMLVGFAFSTGREHALLRDRDGGAPMLERAPLEPLGARGARRALVLVDTDHGLNLGLRPDSERTQGAALATHDAAPWVRRHRGDAIDRLSWEALGRPPTFHYHFAPASLGGAAATPSGRHGAWLTPLAFDEGPTAGRALRIEAESLWPARAQQGAWAWPIRQGAAGASGDGWLRVTGDEPAAPGQAARGAGRVRLALPARALGGRPLLLRARRGADAPGLSATSAAGIALLVDGERVAERVIPSSRESRASAAWVELPMPPLPREPGRIDLWVTAEACVELDYVELGPAGGD